jgi:hypothetical protein
VTSGKAGFWFQLKGERTRLACNSTRPRVELLSPNVRDEALRTTREGACAPHFTRKLEKLHPDNSDKSELPQIS